MSPCSSPCTSSLFLPSARSRSSALITGVIGVGSGMEAFSWICKHTRSSICCPREASKSVIAWLEAHPEVEIVSRDRGGTYVDGVTQGAPLATQVCDRWHLLKNLGEAIEAFLIRAHIRLPEAVVQEPTQERPLTTYSATPVQQGRTQARTPTQVEAVSADSRTP